MKTGSRLRSTVCATAVVVVRAAGQGETVECGGTAMLEGVGDPGSGELKPGYDQGTLLGKRYTDESSGLELLCTKGGAGSLSVEGRVLEPKVAKALPASD